MELASPRVGRRGRLRPRLRRSATAESRLTRFVAGAPVRIRTKLLAALAVIVVLLVAVGALGLLGLARSNQRVETLARLQKKAAAYRTLQNDNSQLWQVVAPKGGAGPGVVQYGSGTVIVPSLETIESTLGHLRFSYDSQRLGFVASASERGVLAQMQADYERLVEVMTQAIALERNGRSEEGRQLVGSQGLPIVGRLEATTDGLANEAETDLIDIVRTNETAFSRSRRVFVGVAAGAVVLALLLVVVISSSVIGPVRRIGDRLANIASGDFSGHVEVANRDELGTLAGHVNSMNDQLKALYEVVQAQAASLTELNSTLEARVDEQAAEIRASRARIVATADAERRRIERNLHDGAQQHLVALAMNLNLARRELPDDPEAAAAMLEQLKGDVRATIEELRNLAHGIYPPLLLDSGLPAALSAAAARSPLPVTVQTDGVGRQSADVEASVYFCCLEALQNAAKHAEGADVAVRVWEEPGALHFEVADKGPGFDPETVSHGQGLINMGDRLAALGGEARWDSTPGAGTRVCGSVPVTEA
jgi:signal transduction histidine kinase